MSVRRFFKPINGIPGIAVCYNAIGSYSVCPPGSAEGHQTMREEKRPVQEVRKTESSIGNVQQRWLALFDMLKLHQLLLLTCLCTHDSLSVALTQQAISSPPSRGDET